MTFLFFSMSMNRSCIILNASAGLTVDLKMLTVFTFFSYANVDMLIVILINTVQDVWSFS